MDYYKKVASNYDKRWKTYTNNSLQKIIDYLPLSLEGKCILDYGCGTGELIKRLLIQKPTLSHVTGYDPVAKMLAQAKVKIRKLPKDVQKKVKLQRQLVFDHKFDIIVSGSVLHYLPKPEDTLGLLKSNLKERGILVLLDYTKDSFPARYFEWLIRQVDSLHQKAYKPEQINRLVENAGFKIRASEEFSITPLWKGFVIKAIV